MKTSTMLLAAAAVLAVMGFMKMKSEKGGLAGNPDRIPGGLAEGKSESDFDPVALEMGVQVEMEHTADPEIAREIAMDHLTEDPAYYEKLAQAGL